MQDRNAQPSGPDASGPDVPGLGASGPGAAGPWCADGPGRRVGRAHHRPKWHRPRWDDPDWPVRRGWGEGPGPTMMPGERRWHRAPAIRLAMGVAVIELIGTLLSRHFRGEPRPLDVGGYALLLAGPLALAFRRVARVPALAATIAAAVAYGLSGHPSGPYLLAPIAAIFGAIWAGRRTAVWICCVTGYLCYVLAGHLMPHVGGVALRRPGLTADVVLGAWMVVTLLLSEAARIRSAHFSEMARTRMEQARARAEQQRRQSSEERLRIARELHDVLGHHLSLINVQAGVGLHLMDERPEQARAALQAIKQASAEALREVRSVLGVLRPEDEAAPRAPAPSLANLSTLVDRERTEAVVEGTPRDLPAELDRAAYRIAQEALTNVRRHAGPDARATVIIGYSADALTVRVVDDGRGGPVPDEDGQAASGDGNGIAGMRARAAALGGTLRAGPRAEGGGFEVLARLPFEAPG